MPWVRMIGESKISNQKTLLVGLLVTAAAIVLFETGTLRLDQNTFQAQAGMADMVLNNNGEGAIIEVGSHIMVANKFEPESFIAGTLGGIENGVIFIKEYKGDETLTFAISDVGSVVYGEPKPVWKHTKQWLKYGGLTALAGGAFFGTLCMTVEDSFFGNTPIERLGFGFLAGSYVTGIFSVPAGTIIGLTRGLIARGRAVEYVIGPNDWQIVQ
jgi:hypothetical protein